MPLLILRLMRPCDFKEPFAVIGLYTICINQNLHFLIHQVLVWDGIYVDCTNIWNAPRVTVLQENGLGRRS